MPEDMITLREISGVTLSESRKAELRKLGLEICSGEESGASIQADGILVGGQPDNCFSFH